MNIYLQSGQLFATNYNRVVTGERGSYVEFTKEQICAELQNKFNYNKEDIYYLWMEPKNGSGEKVYFQLKTVKYADYKVGMYYIDPKLLKDFKYE